MSVQPRTTLASLAAVALCLGALATGAAADAADARQGRHADGPGHSGGFERVDNLPDGSAPARGADAPFLSASGRYSVFTSNGELAGGWPRGRTFQVYWHDARTDETLLVSRSVRGRLGNGDSRLPTISDNGRFVAFSSGASNLLGPAEPVLGVENMYRFDVRTGRMRLVTTPLRGTAAPRSTTGQMSANGRYVALSTDAQLRPEDQNPRFDVYRWDAGSDRTRLVSGTVSGEPADGNSFGPNVSRDGHVAYLSDATGLTEQPPPDGQTPAYLWDPRPGTNDLVSTTPDGEVTSPVDFPIVSDDARYVTFYAVAPTNRFTLYSRDVGTGGVEVISAGASPEQDVSGGRMSRNGRQVLVTLSRGIVGTPDREQAVVIYDRVTGRSVTVTTRTDLTPFDLSADGRAVGVISAADDLTPAPDDNGVDDAFVWHGVS